MAIPRSLRLGLVLVTLLVTACSFVETTPPPPTPADFPGTASEFAKRGVLIGRIVSGDAGCNDRVLGPTAIAFDASGLDQSSKVRIYLYIFRNRATFDRLRNTIDACARTYVTDAQTYRSIDQSPFVMAGQGPWGAKFEAALRTGLEVAAGTGG